MSAPSQMMLIKENSPITPVFSHPKTVLKDTFLYSAAYGQDYNLFSWEEHDTNLIHILTWKKQTVIFPNSETLNSLRPKLPDEIDRKSVV